MLPPTPTQQHYLVLIRLQRKISFVASFTISRWLKKYYCILGAPIILLWTVPPSRLRIKKVSKFSIQWKEDQQKKNKFEPYGEFYKKK